MHGPVLRQTTFAPNGVPSAWPAMQSATLQTDGAGYGTDQPIHERSRLHDRRAASSIADMLCHRRHMRPQSCQRNDRALPTYRLRADGQAAIAGESTPDRARPGAIPERTAMPVPLDGSPSRHRVENRAASAGTYACRHRSSTELQQQAPIYRHEQAQSLPQAHLDQSQRQSRHTGNYAPNHHRWKGKTSAFYQPWLSEALSPQYKHFVHPAIPIHLSRIQADTAPLLCKKYTPRRNDSTPRTRPVHSENHADEPTSVHRPSRS